MYGRSGLRQPVACIAQLYLTHLQPTMVCPTSSLRGSVLELQLASGHCVTRSGDYGLGFVEVFSEKVTAGTELS